jgi:hypothetical protein
LTVKVTVELVALTLGEMVSQSGPEIEKLAGMGALERAKAEVYLESAPPVVYFMESVVGEATMLTAWGTTVRT